MSSAFVAVVPHNKFKPVRVYEVQPATKAHTFRELLFMAYDPLQHRFPVLGEDRVLSFEKHWFWPRSVKWATVRYENEEEA